MNDSRPFTILINNTLSFHQQQYEVLAEENDKESDEILMLLNQGIGSKGCIILGRIMSQATLKQVVVLLPREM